MATLVIYSNKSYEHMVDSFLASRSYANAESNTVVFYMVGYDSDIEYPNLIKRRWDPPIERQNFQFYKPHIMLQSLEFGDDDLIYFDTDILIGKRFNPSKLKTDKDYPIACAGPLNFVYYWEMHDDGTTSQYDESMLKEYFGVKDRTTHYLWTSMLCYNSTCKDFLQEWCSIIDNNYFHRDGKTRHYFPFGDETAFNVLTWKRGCTDFLPRYFVNTTVSDTLVQVESDDSYNYYLDNTFNNHTPLYEIYERCDDSSIVQFYHGIKDPGQIIKVMSWMILNK